MSKTKEETLRQIEKAQALMSAMDWAIDPWKVEKGDKIGFRPVSGIIGAGLLPPGVAFGDVANVTTGTVEKRVNVYVGEGEARKALVFCARSDREIEVDDEAIDWRLVTAHLLAGEIRGVPEKKRRRAPRDKQTADPVVGDVAIVAEVMGKADPLPAHPLIETVQAEERDPTDQGLTPTGSDDGPEDEEDEDETQTTFPVMLPTEAEAVAEVDRLRAEWETKRATQERIAPIAKKHAGRLATARKAESLAYAGLVSARATLARVRSFSAIALAVRS